MELYLLRVLASRLRRPRKDDKAVVRRLVSDSIERISE